MNVLSLFDGMSCGRVALERARIPVDSYYASEIDKYAIKIAQKNYPATIQLGDVINVRHMAEAGVFGHIDLLIGGSPCQGFSFAGKQLAFDDPRSVLFFEFVKTLEALRRWNPNIKFMLENVKMKKEHLDVISMLLGVQPVCINSALVSAQNRVRYYWCNWVVTQPYDQGLFLRDILETDGIGMIKNHNEMYLRNEKSMNLDANYHKGADNHGQRTVIVDTKCLQVGSNSDLQGHEIQRRIYSPDGKSPTLLAQNSGGSIPPKIIKTRHEKNIKSIDDKSFTLLSSMHKGAQANGQSLVSLDNTSYRKLSVLECERLQTLPDDYTEGVSNTQRYKMIGNGWTVDVIKHIFEAMPQ